MAGYLSTDGESDGSEPRRDETRRGGPALHIRPHPPRSAKIRALDAAGYARAEIARFLGKHCSHVRNVLAHGQPRSEADKARPAPSDAPGEAESQELHIAGDGRIVIPSAMLLDGSGHLTARVADGGFRR